MSADSGPGTMPPGTPPAGAPLLLLPGVAAVNAKVPGERQTAMLNTAVPDADVLQSSHVLRWEARRPLVGWTHGRMRTVAAAPMMRHCFGSSARLGEQLFVFQARLGCNCRLAVAKLPLMKLRATSG